MRTLPTTTAAPTPAPAAPAPAPAAHLSDHALAAALFAMWSGDPAVVVASPPGAGKTRLVTYLADQLHRRAGLDVAIAAQTRAQALDLANRAAASGATITLLGRKGAPRPPALHPDATWTTGTAALRDHHGVIATTTARWLWTPDRAWRADVLIVDEAWQLTYADLGALGTLADQIVLVGDPGQISPVVTGHTRRWAHQPTGPHLPAPDALTAAHPDAVTSLRLPQTWRLGPDTTAVIAPAFYPDLPFTSARPRRHLSLHGHPLPELSGAAIPVPAGPNDPTLAAAAADHVRALLTAGTLTDGTLTDDTGARPLTAADIAVVVPHVTQAAIISAYLADIPGLLIATTNQAQGLERDAVVVVHPLAGYRETPPFATDLGRLCVALTRHRTHAHVLHDTATPALLRAALRADPDNHPVRTHQDVLGHLRGEAA